MTPAIQLLQPEGHHLLRQDAEVMTVIPDCRFTEGPVWNSEGYYLFSDITANRIYRWSEADSRTVFAEKSGTETPDDPDLKGDMIGSNGLAYSKTGLLVCRHGSHSVARWTGSALEPVADSYEGRPFNSPNDIVVHPDGSFFFSDPPYGLKEGQLNPDRYQPLAGVYRWRNGKAELICTDYRYPNGVCLSEDGTRLYICSSKAFERRLTEWDTETGARLRVVAEENCDGLKRDRAGNFYLATREGVIVLNPEGVRIALLPLPKEPANLCFGGSNGKDLLVTAREEVYLIKGFFR